MRPFSCGREVLDAFVKPGGQGLQPLLLAARGLIYPGSDGRGEGEWDSSDLSGTKAANLLQRSAFRHRAKLKAPAECFGS